MLDGGYTGKLLRINLSRRASMVEPLDGGLVRQLLGGRGMAAQYYHREIAPGIGPLDEANKLIFFTGPLTGTPLPSTTKFQLATKSPETGRYLCSNCGGNFGPRLKQAGFDALIVEGRASRWSYVTVIDGEVGFGDARPWLGFGSGETLQALLATVNGKKGAALSIGPAAERLVRLAYVNVDSRAFGRGGAGAVLGSKKLKGIAVTGSAKISLADKARVDEIRRRAIEELKTSRANHTRFGTPQYIEIINELGCMPTRNFQTAQFEASEQVDAHAMRDRYWHSNYACFRCPVACGKVCVVPDGPYAGARARTEYESIALLGPNCGISDFGAIVKANQLCDQIGLDTMSTGNAVALVMELFERGLIGKEETGGIEARFGEPEALLGLIELIGQRKAIGDLLAEGMLTVARQKPEWKPYILAVKGLPFAAYDPRGFFGNALTYGTSSRGACHNVGGWTIRAELQSGKYDRFALAGKGALVKSIQDNRAYVDSLGICTVVRGSLGYSDHPEGDALEAITGYPFTPELMRIGERIYNLERVILNREGVRRKDDLMPQRITREAIPSGPTAGRVLTEEMYAQMLAEYYRERGWDENGVPTRQTLEALGLGELASAP
jgi:aldehyde:ferredoxin oxidoreductase